MNSTSVECRLLTFEWQQPLSDFFDVLLQAGDGQYFHPHPLTSEEAQKRVAYTGKDAYYVLVEDSVVLGYGMLRGWDEGYLIPSLGIALHPEMRGKGLGQAFVQFLHAVARLRGADLVRLKVHPDNLPALRLYEKIGYVFQSVEDEQLVGFMDLT